MEHRARTTTQHDFRNRYGDAIAAIVEMHAQRPEQGAGLPASHDIKAALQAIIADPDAADLQRIDSLTRALLMDPAWRRLRINSLRALTRGQLAECAQYALDHFQSFNEPMVERAQVKMTLSLLGCAREWHAPRRNNLLREALSLAFRVGYVRATAIIKKAHREFRAAA
jgi:hypothetical protein